MNPQRFPLPPVGKFAVLVPVLCGIVLPVVAAIILLVQGEAQRAWPVIVFAALVMPLVGFAVARSIHGRQVELLPAGLRVRRWPIAKQSPLADFDLASARVVDLETERGVQPTFKIAGARLPGFRSGWFRLREGGRAYVLTSTGRRALLLRRRDGTAWLLGVDKPDALLAAVRPRR